MKICFAGDVFLGGDLLIMPCINTVEIHAFSLLLDFCTEKHEMKHAFVVQDDDIPQVRDLKGIGLHFYRFWFFVLSAIYKCPQPIYKTLWHIHVLEMELSWRLQINLFHLRQLGYIGFSKKGYAIC